jgi:prophage antirepressor-like protein
MSNHIIIFENKEFGKIRVIELDGQPWFVGKDVCDALGYQNPRKAFSDHIDGKDKNTVTIRDGIQGNPNKTVINESGMYSLILSSRLPSAKRFKRWLTSEVLPSLQKHGAYMTDDVLEEASKNEEYLTDLFNRLQAEKSKTAALTKIAEELVPKAAYYDVVLQNKNTVPVTLIAKDYGMSASEFNTLLYALGIQYRLGRTWVLYQDYAGSGYTHTRTYHAGENVSTMHTCWTQKGRLFLYETLKSWNILPVIEYNRTVVK